KRTATVEQFLEALLPAPVSAQLGAILPTCFVPQDKDKSLREAFEGCRVWFNHVVKVGDQQMLNVRELWKFVARGALVLRANGGQVGVDVVVPVCHASPGGVLSRHTVSAILIQVKNDALFQAEPRPALFSLMDPFGLALFNDGDAALPVIRMVFALAADAPAVVPLPQGACGGEGRYTAYDFWLAGATPDTFPLVGAD
ncbi:hypothetical protein BC834DRAFT_810847, partial [Gloeopeniophorella convolvens]